MIRLINKANAKAHALAQKLTKKDTAKATIEAAETAAKTQSTEDEQTKLLREIRDALTKKPRK